jgi:hypothetical protein
VGPGRFEPVPNVEVKPVGPNEPVPNVGGSSLSLMWEGPARLWCGEE